MFQDAFNCASLAVGCTLNVVDSVLTDEVYWNILVFPIRNTHDLMLVFFRAGQVCVWCDRLVITQRRTRAWASVSSTLSQSLRNTRNKNTAPKGCTLHFNHSR